MAFGIVCAVLIELGPTQCYGPIFRIYGSPFFVVFFTIYSCIATVVEGVFWAVFRRMPLTDTVRVEMSQSTWALASAALIAFSIVLVQ